MTAASVVEHCVTVLLNQSQAQASHNRCVQYRFLSGHHCLLCFFGGGGEKGSMLSDLGSFFVFVWFFWGVRGGGGVNSRGFSLS